jgi:hypothetical protein
VEWIGVLVADRSRVVWFPLVRAVEILEPSSDL